MERPIATSRHVTHLLWLLLAGCSDPTSDDAPFSGDYSALFEPPLAVAGPVGCDRLVTYTILGLQRDLMFDLSINVVDDCRRSGRGSSYFGVEQRGRWEPQADTLLFTTDDVIPTFGGEREGGTLVLRIPPNFAAITNNAMALRLASVETP